MIKTKEQFEQEIYRLLSTRGKIDAEEVDGVGVNYDVATREHRVNIVMMDGSILMGEKIDSTDIEKIVNMFSTVADTFFTDNGVLIEPTT